MEARPLRDVRRRNLLSIQALAKKAGVSPKTIVDLEHGRTVPQLRTVGKLSEALGVAPLEVEEFVVAIENGDQGKELAAA
ncbi:MAG TPA: helix-turn-helix transcriptional regulator [Chloroflexota bacterium]|nr:helix-turn-helix transcriptional regulator [Chloroflexota bacterium]